MVFIRNIFVAAALWTFALSPSIACVGKKIEGPWFSFKLPEGMTLSGEIAGDSAWIERGEGSARIMFFVYAPQHGGTPYRAYLDAEEVTHFIRSPNDLGEDQTFVVSYRDGSTGLFEGTSQLVTGIRVFDEPLSGEGQSDYECFLESIRGYTN